MREVVIASGKGGVGKSSIVASLAVLAGRQQKVVLADTDVDAPNLHLVLGARLTRSEEIAASAKAFIDYDKCSACLTCREVCRFAAILSNDRPIIIPYSCEGCGACTLICPEEAIAIKEVVNGQLNIFAAENMVLVAGELHVGASSSGRLVDIVKKKARQQAESSRAAIILVDGPPGIGCPVIAAVKGADYVVLVTEPTPAAFHDLQRLVTVVSHFRIPLGIVLNRADSHSASSSAIRHFGQEHGFPILAEIPDDNSMTMALASGRPVVSAYPESPASLALQELAEAVAARIRERGACRT